MKPSELCVVFDLDDTLYLERDFVRSGFHAVGERLRRERGAPGFAAAAWRAFERGLRGRIFDAALTELGLEAEPSLIASLVVAYRAHEPRIRLPADAVACLDSLAGRVRLALLSDGPARTQRNKLQALGLASRFEPLALTALHGPGHSKPHPEAFERVAAAVPEQRFVYVADNPAKDFQAPRRLGWRTIRIRRPAGLYAALEPAPNARADRELPDLRRLPALLFPG